MGETDFSKMIKGASLGLSLVIFSATPALSGETAHFSKALVAAYGAVVAKSGGLDELAHRIARAKQGVIDPPLIPVSGLSLTITHDRWQNPGYSPSNRFGDKKIDHPEITFRKKDPSVEEANRPEMIWTRQNLILALAKGARHSHEHEAAKAQASFDCWILGGDNTCADDAKTIAATLAEILKEKPYHVETAASIPGRPCRDDPQERRYSFGDYDNMTPSIAEALDRARTESASGIACFETKN